MPHGVSRFYVSMDYDEALPDTEVEIQWYRDGRRLTTSRRTLSGGSGYVSGYVGYEEQAMPRGNYEVRIVASLSKQGQLHKTWRVQ